MASAQVLYPAGSDAPRHAVSAQRSDLEIKISALSDLVGSRDFQKLEAPERELLIEQLGCMQKYSLILAKRLLLY